MLRRLIASGLVAALTIGSAAPAFGASHKDGVNGGGSVLVSSTGVHGSVSVRASLTADGVTGRVNLDLQAPGTGERVQHFKGSVTSLDLRAAGVAHICGVVDLLQLGTNTNEGRFFEMVVQDVGQPGQAADLLGWYRQDSSTDCTDDYPRARQELVEGNFKVVD